MKPGAPVNRLVLEGHKREVSEMLLRHSSRHLDRMAEESSLQCDLRWGWLTDVVTLSGTIDTSNASQLGALLDQLDHNAIVDCRELGSIDSLGIDELLGAWQRLEESGQHMRLHNIQPNVESALGSPASRQLVGDAA